MGALESEKAQLLPFTSSGKQPRNSNSSLNALLSKVTGSVSNAGVIRVLAALGVSVGWMFVSSLLILVNKHILKDLKFGYVWLAAGSKGDLVVTVSLYESDYNCYSSVVVAAALSRLTSVSCSCWLSSVRVEHSNRVKHSRPLTAPA